MIKIILIVIGIALIASLIFYPEITIGAIAGLIAVVTQLLSGKSLSKPEIKTLHDTKPDLTVDDIEKSTKSIKAKYNVK